MTFLCHVCLPVRGQRSVTVEIANIILVVSLGEHDCGSFFDLMTSSCKLSSPGLTAEVAWCLAFLLGSCCFITIIYKQGYSLQLVSKRSPSVHIAITFHGYLQFMPHVCLRYPLTLIIEHNNRWDWAKMITVLWARLLSTGPYLAQAHAHYPQAQAWCQMAGCLALLSLQLIALVFEAISGASPLGKLSLCNIQGGFYI